VRIRAQQGKEANREGIWESADGDVVAAHIAFGNDYLCTEDRGGSTGSLSIFDAENRAWLKTEYMVEILNVQQLANLL
jgi:hypothetical protein